MGKILKRGLTILFLAFLFVVSLIFLPMIVRRTNPPKLIDQNTSDPPRLTVIADNLDIPWSLAFLPDLSLIFTQRSGQVRLLNPSGQLASKPLLILPNVRAVGEGGLLGLTLHPEFYKNHFLYLYYTYSSNGNDTMNRVVRYTLVNNQLIDQKIIVDKIPGAIFHNGGRLKFGPDGYLYITTGDSLNPSLAQDPNALAGKILRVTDLGMPVPGNHFENLIFSYGHRNPQGLTWDDQNNLWETEHGSSAHDELNLIKIGNNYGWPTIIGNQTQTGLVTPIINSGNDTWAPSGLAYLKSYLYFVGLRGSALYRVKVTNGKISDFKVFLKNELGRLRDVIVGPDDMLYLTTNNRDGRGVPLFGDDKIIRLNPDKL